jgi:hypothetical protein
MKNKQMNIWKGLLLFSVLMLFAVPLVSAAPAPAMYLNPEPSSVNCGESTTVEVRINTSANSMGAYAWIYFDPACVNITNVNYTGAPWQPMVQPGWSHQGDHVILSTANFNGVAKGDHLFATIEVECVGCDCTSEIGFTKPEPTGVVAYNGTFTCEAAPSLNVAVTINNATFGTMLAGNRQELNVSLTMNNTGTVDANITAVFKSNVTTGTYGLNETSGNNIISGNNFALGPDGYEKALTNTTTTTFISTIPADEEVTYDAILVVPAGQAAGDYSGIVELIIEESS